MRLCFILAAGILTVPRATAQAENCTEAATQTAMSACAAVNLRTVDATLNTTYEQVMNRLRDREEVKRRLVASEHAWMRFRDTECTFVANQVDGGSGHAMVLANCRTALTQDRVNQLHSYLTCQEGDLSCPLPPK